VSGYVHDQSEAAMFTRSRELFEGLVAGLVDPAAAELAHTDLEDQLATSGRELMCALFQDHLDLRAAREDRRVGVTDAEGIARTRVERGHERDLATVFGTVRVTRMAYRAPGAGNLYPADAVLNLPGGKHSHGLRRLAAVEAARGSFADAAAAIERATGTRVGKRQVEQLAQAVDADVEAFYAARRPAPAEADDVLVLSVDGKGVVMRPEALRAATARAGRSRKLSTRLSKGEKRDRKRMAEVAAVYDLTPHERTPADIITVPHSGSGSGSGEDEPTDAATAPEPAPRARGKWLTASLTHTTAQVIAAAFDEAERRDPDHARPWVALVDGNAHQIQRIHTEADRRGIPVPIVIDFVHVAEYLWKAAWCFHSEGDPAAEAWVAGHALRILNGQAGTVAAAIRRKATTLGLDPARRRNADTTATYLINKKAYLDYPTALESGWPIATGVIEGACRHLVKDRMDITGARWGLPGAEAVLRLRALLSNGDFDAYWTWHLDQERHRTHLSHYQDHAIAG
jgi:hypothetical protein